MFNGSPRVRGALSWPAAALTLADPLIAVATYVVLAFIWGRTMNGWDLALLVTTFTLMSRPNLALAIRSHGIFRDIVESWILVAALLAALLWLPGLLWHFDKFLLIEWGLAVPIVLYAAHKFERTLAPRVLAAIEGTASVVIVGATEAGRALATQFQTRPLLNRQLMGFFDDRDPARVGDNFKLLGRLAELPDYVRANSIGAIYITLPMAMQPRLRALLEDLYDTTTSIYFVPEILMHEAIQPHMDDMEGIPIVTMCESPFGGLAGLVKRLEDLALATLGVALAAPLFAVIAVGVKLSSPGPVFFRQRRYGLDGREIRVFKFRTMRVMEDGPHVRQAEKNDPRITRFGAFLRRTSLDELPQLFNVLTGEMSLVGPRPHAVAHNEAYRKLIRGYMIRHKVRPGITGWAQVNGYRGETETVEKMKKRVEFDLDYLRFWSLRLDLLILVKTLFVAVGGRNAH